MRLRLFERLSRLASRCFGSRAEGRGWTRDSRPRDDAGRHRRSAGATPSRLPDGPLQFPEEQPQPPAGFQQPPAAFQEPAGFQQRAGYPVQPSGARADAWADGTSGPSVPKNYGPGPGDVNETWLGGPAGHGPAAGGPAGGGAGRTAATRPAAGGSRHGGGIGRARIKEAPFGAAPAAMETVAVGQESAATAPPNAAPKEP